MKSDKENGSISELEGDIKYITAVYKDFDEKKKANFLELLAGFSGFDAEELFKIAWESEDAPFPWEIQVNTKDIDPQLHSTTIFNNLTQTVVDERRIRRKLFG